MLKADVKIGGVYMAKIGDRICPVRLVSEGLHGRGWNATNMTTGRAVRIKSAAKLRRPARNSDLLRSTDDELTSYLRTS